MSSDPAPSATIDDVSADPASTQTAIDAGSPAQVSADGAGPQDGPVVLDPAALDVARAAAVSEAGVADHVGDLLTTVAEDDVAVTVTFRAAQPGYQGWHWSVTLAVLDGQRPTVSEVVLLPGQGALLAPAWVPWDQRIRAGDVGVGDLLPPPADDPRVVPAYLQSDDPAVEAVARELGIGRVRVLSREGRTEFAERLHEGSFGPTDDMALSAPGQCVTCAFYLPLAGSLGALAGACGNEFAPADGRVVDAAYGCGAHSETVIQMPARSAATDTVIDELALEVHRRPVAALPEEPAGDDSVADSAVSADAGSADAGSEDAARDDSARDDSVGEEADSEIVLVDDAAVVIDEVVVVDGPELEDLHVADEGAADGPGSSVTDAQD